MLSTLFKGKNPLTAAPAEERLAAIAALTPDTAASLAEELAACARDDPDLRVRRAALGWVDDRQLLESLLDDAGVTEAAAGRLAKLGADIDHPGVRQARMRAATSTEEALTAAKGTTAPEALATLFLCCPGPYREALLPAVRLLGEQGLSVLERQSRNHDKSANRTARAELDHLRAVSRTIDELRARGEELKTALVRETAGTAPARTQQLHRALEDCLHNIKENAEQLAPYGIQMPKVEGLQAVVDAPPPVETAPVAEAAPQADTPGFDTLAAGFQALNESMVAGAALDSLRKTRDELTDKWLAQADHSHPEQEHQAIFETVAQRYRELAEATERLGNLRFGARETPEEISDWPKDPEALQALWKQQRDLERTRIRLQRQIDSVRWPSWAPLPEPLGHQTEAIAGLQGFGHRLAEHQQKLEAELATLIDRTQSDAADGRLKPAHSALGQARKIARSLPEQSVQRHRKALLAAATRVRELQDWQAFATSPKRQELLDSMQALAGETTPNPKDRADKIKALRAEWNALGPLSGTETRKMQTEFDRFAELAFEPCRAHFSEQAERRKRNLAERRLICEQLEAYLDHVDWASADMRAAERILRAAREGWRAHHPVDRKYVKELENRFEALQERLFAKIKRVWDANLAAKKAIVAAAETLATGELSTSDKIREAKALQRQWREVGITPRKPDQQLWRQFRKHCDLIFETLESNRKQADSELQSAIDKAESICESMQDALAAAEAEPATADRTTLARLRGELNTISLPERLEKSLHRRFDEIARNYNQLILAGEIDNLCRELEDIKAQDIEASRAKADGPGNLPQGDAAQQSTAEEALADASTAAPSSANDGEAPLEALHRLTLEAEILARVESPPADQQLRLEVQVDVLNQRMGRRAPEKEPKELAEAWCRLGPKSEASDTLRERFFDALLTLARPHDR